MQHPKKIAYLISQYPALSHTFIMREILKLRELGWEIHVASINLVDRPIDQLTKTEKQEADLTYYVKQTPAIKILSCLLKSLFLHPFAFFHAFFAALCLGQGGPKQRLYNLFYFVEALLVGSKMKKWSVTHLHVHFLNPASTVGLLVTKLFPFTLSITAHGPDEFFDVSQNELTKKIAAARFINCISYYCRSQLMRRRAPCIPGG